MESGQEGGLRVAFVGLPMGPFKGNRPWWFGQLRRHISCVVGRVDFVSWGDEWEGDE